MKVPLTCGFGLRPTRYRAILPILARPGPGRAHLSRRENHLSAFRKGDTVVHPEHGAAVIDVLKDKEFLGEKRK